MNAPRLRWRTSKARDAILHLIIPSHSPLLSILIQLLLLPRWGEPVGIDMLHSLSESATVIVKQRPYYTNISTSPGIIPQLLGEGEKLGFRVTLVGYAA